MKFCINCQKKSSHLNFFTLPPVGAVVTFMRYVDILAYLREMANAQSINFVCPITVKLALIVEVVDQKGPRFRSRPLFLGQKSSIREYTRDSHILSSLASFCSGCTDSRRTCRQCCKEKFGICIHR